MSREGLVGLSPRAYDEPSVGEFIADMIEVVRWVGLG